MLATACQPAGGPATTGSAPCPFPTERDYAAAAATFDAASYFPTGFYSTVPFWKPYEQSTPPERRDPKDNPLFAAAAALGSLGEESLYARRAEPELQVYRLVTRSQWFVSRVTRAERRGPMTWVERRSNPYCQLAKHGAALVAESHVEISEADLPAATWLAIDQCMDRAFWTVPMEDGEPPAAPDHPVGLDEGRRRPCLLEGVRGGEYHAIERTCTTPDAGTRDPLLDCLELLEGAARP